MYNFIEKFFTDLGIQIESISLKEEGDDLYVELKTPDSHLLIGTHGKNLDSIQHLLGRIAEKEKGQFVHLHLEVNDYMKTKDERLFQFLDSKIRFILQSKKSISIPNLSSFERKKAHNYVAEKYSKDISTRSEGEGEDRILILSYIGGSGGDESIETGKNRTFGNDLSEDGVGI